eukprot:gene12131-13384_t
MEEPRELPLEMFQCSDEVLDSLEELQYKVEELQLFCEGCAANDEEMQRRQIDVEREHKKQVKDLNEELSNLRKTKLHILRENIMKECAVTPRWFNTLMNSVNQEKHVKELTTQLDNAKIGLMEKDQIITSLQWKVKNSEATISVLNADRTRLLAEIDAMTLRIEEHECADNFRRHNYDSGNHGSASLCSIDEATNFGNKPSQVSSCNSYVASDDDGSSGVGTLKRAANFSDINILDESADFQRATSTILSDPFTDVSSMQTSCTEVFSLMSNNENSRNENNAGKCEKVGDAKGVNALNNDGGGDDDKDLKVVPADLQEPQIQTSWETFEISENRDKPEEHPRRSETSSEELVHDTGDTSLWLSPSLSPVVVPKSNRNSNPFWDSIENTSKLPFFIPQDDNEDCEDIVSNFEKEFVKKDTLEVNENNHVPCPNFESSPCKKLINTSAMRNRHLPKHLDSFNRERSHSLNSEFIGRARKNVLRKAESKDDLWDFEPDSIVDVSTGETIYESHDLQEILIGTSTTKFNEEKHSVTNGDNCLPLESSTEQNSAEQDSYEETAKEDEHRRKFAKQLEKSTEEDDATRFKKSTRPKVTSSTNSPVHKDSKLLSLEDGKRKFIKKRSKKEREVFHDFLNWKTHGKQGEPPANLKVSL